MKTTALIVIGLILFGIGATYYRYESFSPCEWIVQDLSYQDGLPPVVVEGRLRAGFLVDGKAKPDALDCLLKWWELKASGKITAGKETYQ